MSTFVVCGRLLFGVAGSRSPEAATECGESVCDREAASVRRSKPT